MAICHGNGSDHCCNLGAAGVCTFLEENTVPGRRWACGLFRELGSWGAVHTSSRYLSEVRPKLDAYALPDCGDWPQTLVPLPKGACCYG